ncbi:MAG: hypothetical protein AAF290_07335 [Pseudomonadota bacterium]
MSAKTIDIRPAVYALLLTALNVIAFTAHADPGRDSGIVSTSGDIRFLRAPPRSVDLWELESDDDLFVFAERKRVLLTEDLPVDISRPGDYKNQRKPRDPRDWSVLSPGVIPAGTKVDAYYFHFDNASYTDNLSVRGYFACQNQIRVSGRITFAKPVLGIVMRAYARDGNYLGLSNEVLGLSEVEYCEHNFRHFPGANIADGCGSDRFVLSKDRRTLWLTNFTDVHHDNYRVVVAAE